MEKPNVLGPAAQRGPSRRHYTWAVVTAVLVLCGVVASVVAAGAVGRNQHDRSVRSFQRSSADVASTLQLALQHDDDLVVDAGALVTLPDLTQSEFLRWATASRVLSRYPEMSGVAILQLVDNADLPAFAKRAVADPIGPLAADGTFAVVPTGTRAFYCLVTAAVGTKDSVAPAGIDYCADPLVREKILGARSSGQGAYLPYASGGRTLLAIETPVYRAGLAPTTTRGRRAAFAGVVGTQLDPTVLLDRALKAQPGLAVSMRFHGGSTDTEFDSDTGVFGGTSMTTDLHNGWTVQTFGRVDSGGIARGDAVWVLIGGTAVSVLLGLLLFVLATGRERTRRQLVQRTSQLHHLALHDALTGLPNRALVMDRIEQMLVRGRRQQTQGAVLFLDLDDFKYVNDTLGHGAGDRLLIAVTARLASTLRGVDTIGRMGGDEFVVILDSSSPGNAPELVAQRLLDALHQPFELDGTTMPLTVNVSIGIAAGDRRSAGELLRDADIALYQAKTAGKNRYEIFDPQVQTTIGRRTALEGALRTALTDGQYRLMYLPIYSLDDLSLVGVEALLRWDHPIRGTVQPDVFIPILEETGQIREVGRWVLREACQQMATWHARGDTLDISVNVSGGQLAYDGITDDIRDALEASGLSPSALILEVSEASLMHSPPATAQRLTEMKGLGIRVAVDDFGTAYSSLSYLRQFPVDCLKIDRAFTSALTASPEAKALVGTLVQLGKDLGLSILAEGVETTDELDILRGAHVDQAQGFLMARPLDPDTFEAALLAPTRTQARAPAPDPG